MIVFGDHAERVRTAERLQLIDADLRRIATLEAGISRHAAVMKSFIALGQIVQGIADADLSRRGIDGTSTAETALMPSLCRLADALILPWESAFACLAPLPAIVVPPDVPEEIELRVPEGYAFYALYPETYAHAARNLKLPGHARVIGIRSIGTSLSAMVAAVLGAPPPLTLRPLGDPFDRHVAVSPCAVARLLDAPDASYVVVDEGPGLSGSSFAAVAEFLSAQGISHQRIHFLTSHPAEPGIHTSESTRKCWAAVRRTVADSDAVVTAERLASWATELLGTLDNPLVDISAGRWRSLHWPDVSRWPATNPHQERRKFLARAGGETWLLKFAGLGGTGEAKLAAATLLHSAGLVPEVRGLLYGFLVQRWVDASPLNSGDEAPIRSIAHYLAARAELLSEGGQGASIRQLYEMARRNITDALGPHGSARIARWEPMLDELQSRSMPMRTDNRCDAHKWLRLPDGRVLKADAADHHAGHDLIGCQDLAWDVAGVSVEFGLNRRDTDELVANIERLSARSIDRALLSFLTPCYLAFRLGAATLAADALVDLPVEAERNREAARRYAALLGVVPAGDEGVALDSACAGAGAALLPDAR